MAVLRSLVMLVMVGGLALFGAAMPIGDYTLFGHFQRIWNAEETQEMVRSVAEEGRPALERVARGVKAGFQEAVSDPQAEDKSLRSEAPHTAEETNEGDEEKSPLRQTNNLSAQNAPL
jgi:hypothetical protein